jgi:hypothetical protein
MGSNDNLRNQALLTVDDYLRLKDAYESDVRLLAELPQRIERQARKLEAAALFLPAGFDVIEWSRADVQDSGMQAVVDSPVATKAAETEAAERLGDDDSDPGRLSWTVAILAQLLKSGRGMSHSELLDILKATPLGEGLSQGAKGFYNGIARLSKSGKIVKAGGLLYAAEIAEQLKRSGEELPEWTSSGRQRAGGSGRLVLEELMKHEAGLTAPRLKELVGTRPDAPKSMSLHSHYIYNILGTLVGTGAVEKGADGVYRITDAGEKHL